MEQEFDTFCGQKLSQYIVEPVWPTVCVGDSVHILVYTYNLYECVYVVVHGMDIRIKGIKLCTHYIY